MRSYAIEEPGSPVPALYATLVGANFYAFCNYDITRLLMFVPTFFPHPRCHQQEGVPTLVFEPHS